MVDIDGDVVEACKEHLPEMHEGCFDSPRVNLVIDDALKVLEETDAKWDVIISDLSDPIEEGPSFKLFTKEYFEQAKAKLTPGGAMVVQSGPVGPAEMGLHVRLANTLANVFKDTASYSSYVPTYASPWSFVLCSDEPLDSVQDANTIDAALKANLDSDLKMLDGISLTGMLRLPKHLREAIAAETEVYSLAAPPKFFGKGVAEG